MIKGPMGVVVVGSVVDGSGDGDVGLVVMVT
jgi:hypothetical protein